MIRRAVVVDPFFPARLRALREERRLSYRDLGRLAAYSHTTLWEVETGRKPPTPELASRLDEVLATGGVLSRLVTVPALKEPLTADDADRLGYVARHPQRVDAAAVGVLSALLADYRQREDAIGSTPLLVPVTDELGRIGELLRDAHGSVRHRLVDVAAQWAQFLGWLNTAAGRPVIADTWLDRALVLATEAGNTDMVSTVLSFKGHLAWTVGDIGPMVSLTEAALQQPGVYIGQLAYDQLQGARSWAVTGETGCVESALSRAADLAAEAREYTGAIPPWHYYRTPAFFALERGRVLRYLAGRDGYSRRAIDELTAGLGTLPADQRAADWAGGYALDLAVVMAVDGDRRGALVVLDEVDRIARSTAAQGLGDLAQRLRRRIAANG